jgi:RND family efflux transporter MFP subunit
MVSTLKHHRLRILIIAFITVAVTAGILYVNTLSRAEASETATTDKDDKDTPVPVRVAEVEQGSISSYLSATANLVPEHQVKVLAETTGRVAEVKIEEGERVTRGQTLAVLVRDEAEIAMRKARLRASNASLAFERASGTLAQGLISREEFDRLKMEHEVAQQEVAEAEWRLSQTSIRAPFAGMVTERLVHPGQHVQPGAELFMVADFNPLVARIYIPEKDVLHLEVGRGVDISLAADSSYRFAGTIHQISPVVDTATGTVKVTVEAIEPPSQARPGAFVSIDIIREHRSATVLVPRESVIRELRTAHVFVVEDDEAVKREVTLGLEEGHAIEALSGVEVGQRVIVAGHGSLKPGTKIKVL